MTDLQKLEIRAADIRQRLAAIGGMDELTDEIRSEMDALRGEYTDVETKQIALKISSDIPEPIITSTAEGREYGQLITRSNIGEIFDASISHKPLVGATGELQTHLGLELNQIPLAMLQRQPLETRAVTPAPGNVGVNQGPILMYVFPDSAAAFLDVAMPTVGVGEALYPIMTNAPNVGTPNENDEQAETTGAFTTTTLAPARLQASYYYSREDRARFSGMAEALRESLSMGLSDGLDDQILSGTAGLFTGTVIPNHNVTDTTTFDLYMSQFAYGRVDGRYASSASEIKTIMGSHAYEHCGATYRNTSVDRNALERLMEVTGGVKVSSHVPAAASNRQNAIMKVGMNGQAAVAPVWEGISLIPDEITRAARGQIQITAVMLYSFKVLRTDDFYKQQILTV